MNDQNDYVLGTDDVEIKRLGLQHRVWRPRALDAWRRAGFTSGQILLDVGCGPGHATIDLAEIVEQSGKVIAVDKSQTFLNVLESQARGKELTNIEVHRCDFDNDELPDCSVDGLWVRWVLAFVRNPERLLKQMWSRVKPGGVIAIHEYFHYATWRLTPVCKEFDEFVDLVIRSWRDAGGEPDIGLRLPIWLETLGGEVLCSHPIIDVVRPANYVWQWPKSFLYSGARRLTELRYLSEEGAARILAEFAAAEGRPGTRMVTPGVLEIIALRK